MGISLYDLERIIAERAISRPSESHTIKWLDRPLDEQAKKIGEEATELVIEILMKNHEKSVKEAADLFYHTLITFRTAGISLSDIEHELALRHTQMTGYPKLDRKGT